MKRFAFIAVFKTALILSALFFLCSCSGKKENDKQDNLPESEMVNAFIKARVPLLKSKVSSRNFSLPLLAQSTEQKLSDLRGSVVFLNFWATWCGPCRAEMPSMESLYNKYKEKGFVMLAVNCGEKTEDVLTFRDEYNFSFPIALDDDGKVSTSYGVQAIPTTFIIDRDGNIIARLVGSIDWDTPEFHTALELLLNL